MSFHVSFRNRSRGSLRVFVPELTIKKGGERSCAAVLWICLWAVMCFQIVDLSVGERPCAAELWIYL